MVLPFAASGFPAASGQNVFKMCTSLWTDDGKMRLGSGPGSNVSIQELFTRQDSEHLTGCLAESGIDLGGLMWLCLPLKTH